MALRLRRDVQKASYYVWFLGAEEAKGLRGARVINSVLPYLVDRSRGQEPLKVTLQVSHKGIKIVQGSSKHLIPHSAITSSVQTDDIVACVLLLYNPATKCPLHVHAYRCDSETTAEALHLQLQVLINRPDNQKRFEELETRLGILPPLSASGHNSSSKSHDPAQKSVSSSSHHQSQQQHQQSASSAYPHQAQSQRRHETSPKRFSSSLGSDTGNSTRESECSEEHVGGGAAGSPMSRSPPHGGKPHHQQLHHQPLTPQQNSELFDSLAAELRAKLNGNGPPLLLPPRDYDTVHRSKGNLTAIELRRCRNALIVGGAVTSKAAATAAAGTAANGKQVSSRGSSGIGSDLAPSPERQELNSSSDDEHWSNEADNSVIALKPSQIAMERSGPIIPHHPQLKRKSAVQPPEDSYLRDLPAKPYVPRQAERERERTKPPVTGKSSWTREDDIKPVIVRPADYDAKFNRVMQQEQPPIPAGSRYHGKHEAAPPKLRDTDKYNEINRLLNKKLASHDRERTQDRERERERERERDRERDSPEQYKPMPRAIGKSQQRSVHDDELDADDFDDSDPASDQTPSGYRKENLTDKQKFLEYTSKKQQQQQQVKSYAAEEAQRYGGSRHRYVDPVELPFEQSPPAGAGHNKYAAVHRGVHHSPQRSDLSHRTAERRHERELDEVPPTARRHSREREQHREHYSRSKERNPYREAESLPYIQSIEKMMKSSAMRSSAPGRRDAPDYGRDYVPPSNVTPRDRFHDAKDKFRAMERTGSRYDLVADEHDSNEDYKSSARRRRGSVEPPSYEHWSDEEPRLEQAERNMVSRSRTRSRDVWEAEEEARSNGGGSMRHAAERRDYRDSRDQRRLMPEGHANKQQHTREHSRDAYRHEPVCASASASGYSQRERERERDSSSRHQGRAHSREYLSSRRDYSPPGAEPPPMASRNMDKSTVSGVSSSSAQRHHAEMYPSPTPSSSAGGNAPPSKQLSNMPKGYRHSYAEPVFARSGGRVGLAAVNPY